MLKPHKLCNVCRQAESVPQLVKDIYDSKAFNKNSSLSLKDVWEKYSLKHGEQFTYEALLNHTKKHQFMSEKDYNSRHLRQIAKQAEKQILKNRIESSQVWDDVISKGMNMLEEGTLHMKTADLLKAAKDKSDFELKTKDQEMAFAEMMYFFASGENQNNLRKPYDRRFVEGETVKDNDVAVGTPADSGEGENGPGGVYYPPAWDALAPGASSIPSGNNS